MDTTVTGAIVGAIAGIITGSISSLIAPWANWGIEKRKQKLAYRRELIAKWRQLISEAARYEQKNKDKNPNLTRIFIENHPDYYSFHRYSNLMEAAPNIALMIMTSEKNEKDGVSPIGMNPYLVWMVDKVSDIEKEWDLI